MSKLVLAAVENPSSPAQCQPRFALLQGPPGLWGCWATGLSLREKLCRRRKQKQQFIVAIVFLQENSSACDTRGWHSSDSISNTESSVAARHSKRLNINDRVRDLPESSFWRWHQALGFWTCSMQTFLLIQSKYLVLRKPASTCLAGNLLSASFQLDSRCLSAQ